MKDISLKNYHRYSVISAVYNVSPYLDDFFKSLVQQTFSFENNIQLIMVDDGSTDNSANIIQKWQEKYPNNITYIYKENGGQASARNLGLEHLQTPWVTFIDPDDFVNKHYFEKVDQIVHKYRESDLAMIGCNIQFYFERLKLYLDKHPLKYRFENGNTHCAIKEMGRYIQLSASTAFFRTELIQKQQLTFDIKIKPNFEDAHFVNVYLIENYHTSSVAFLKDAKYYYRRRKVQNSTLDTSWGRKELYGDVLRFGCLDLFEKANNKLDYSPKFLQRTILYHLSWYYKYIMDYPEVIAFLSQNQQSDFRSLLQKIFDYIDIETIEKFDLSGINNHIKQGWITFYKKQTPLFQEIHIYKYRNVLHFYYYANKPKSLYIQINDTEIHLPEPTIEKYTFSKQPFINKYEYKLSIFNLKNIFIQLDNSPTYLKTGTNQYIDTVRSNQIKRKSSKILKQLLYNIGRKIILGK